MRLRLNTIACRAVTSIIVVCYQICRILWEIVSHCDGNRLLGWRQKWQSGKEVIFLVVVVVTALLFGWTLFSSISRLMITDARTFCHISHHQKYLRNYLLKANIRTHTIVQNHHYYYYLMAAQNYIALGVEIFMNTHSSSARYYDDTMTVFEE